MHVDQAVQSLIGLHAKRALLWAGCNPGDQSQVPPLTYRTATVDGITGSLTFTFKFAFSFQSRT